MCDELSSYSFGVTAGGALSALGKYAAYCQPVGTSMGGFRVGGAADGVPSFATVKIDDAHVGATEPPPPPPLSDDATDGAADDRVYPVRCQLPESNEEGDPETVSDARRSVVPRHAPLAGQALGGATVDSFGDIPDGTGGDAMPAAIPPRKQISYRRTRQGFDSYRVIPLPPALDDTDPPVPGYPPYSPPPYSSDDERGGGLNRQYRQF
ncbi:hypothetical protein CYMTET_40558 [Cymbomonas tetramitiformis]|uniref:Uncharacterized protein n=1 Tax=Cymbomonas tetramitiformis TaxID=36881 RepID=A0AAE0F353_9CHLO|nr:hypothetical protein CYMTET_40558 [Cymbomonas tetramitiformis]